MAAFTDLALSAPLQKAIEVRGFTAMTPVQEHALPPALLGKDIIAQARTGSGKTVAFALTALSRVDTTQARVQALVLCPTRELAEQVSQEVRKLGRFIANLKLVTLCGGVPAREQSPSLVQAPHVVVGTPGRILDHLARESLELEGVRVLVLDEADRMLDMGFADAIKDVVAQCGAERQTLLFSATYPDDVRGLATRMLKKPVEVTVDAAAASDDIRQEFLRVEDDHKLAVLLTLLQTHQPSSTLVFVHTKNDARDVAAQLAQRGVRVLALHGDLEQRERDEVLLQFANHSCSVLVATDVAARGLDIAALPLVVAWELPTDPDIHTHRIGRTGRAGQKGLAVSLCGPREQSRVRPIEERTGIRITWSAPPAPSTAPLPKATMMTLLIEGGRQDKLRPGDVLGALTGDGGIPGDAVGKIDVQATRTYVAIRVDEAARAAKAFARGKIKGKTFRARPLGARKSG